MTTAHSYAEALSAPEQVTELALHLDATSEPPPPGFAAKLQHVTKLSVHGPVDGSIDFPAELFDLPIETLNLGGFHAYEIFDFKKTLRHFELSNHFLRDDIGPLLKNLTGLKSLGLRGVMIVLTPFELPATIARLDSLEALSLESLKMTNLPNEFENLPALRSLTLRQNKFEQLPAVVTRLWQLTTLRIEESLTQLVLPDEFAALTQLEVLSLRSNHPARSFEEFLDVMFEEDDAKRAKVPAVLRALPALQHLDLGECELTDLDGLEALHSLRELNLEHNSFRDLAPVGALTSLKRLNISNCFSVKYFGPLEGVPLERLDAEGCHLRDLPVVLRSPTLREVSGDAELNAAWARRAEFTALGSTEALRHGLRSADFATASKALAGFCSWVELTSTHDSNSVASFFGLEIRNEEVPTSLGELSTLLETHGSQLDRAQLLELARTLFQSTSDNFVPTIALVERLIERRDVDGQLAFVGVFQEACGNYDPGHRFYSSTVHDVLIDRLFPQFEGEALARLLLWCADDYLLNDHGLDAMDALFKPAFERVTSPTTADQLLERFRAYVKSLEPHYRDDAEQLRVSSPIASINAQLAELFNP